MGCDIHFYVEVRKNGKWQTADKWTAPTEEWQECPHVEYGESFYDSRNYDLFSIFANVRNGSGFAGIVTGEGFVPLAMPRGIPEDACPEYKAVVQQWDGDGHSHSFFTVAEIMAYDWTRTTKKQGWVGRQQYARFKINGSPEAWSGAIAGGGVQHISNKEMEALDLKDGEYDQWAAYHAKEEGPFNQGSHYTLVSWQIPYYRAGKEFLSEVLPRLWRLAAPEDVRCVFFFDN